MPPSPSRTRADTNTFFYVFQWKIVECPTFFFLVVYFCCCCVSLLLCVLIATWKNFKFYWLSKTDLFWSAPHKISRSTDSFSCMKMLKKCAARENLFHPFGRVCMCVYWCARCIFMKRFFFLKFEIFYFTQIFIVSMCLCFWGVSDARSIINYFNITCLIFVTRNSI